jgi:hypothetical protein
MQGKAAPNGLEPVAASTSLTRLLSAGRPQVQTLIDIYVQALGGTLLHAPSTNEIQIMTSRIEAALQSGRLLLYRRRTLSGTWSGGPLKLEVKKVSQGPAPSKEDEWIEIVLVDDAGQGVPNERYLIVGPDGKEYKGVTDQDGVARVDGISKGMCKASFPDLHEDSWERK